MRLHRFIGDFKLDAKQIKVIDKDNVYQLRRVLRLQIGEKVILADGKLNEAVAQITGFGKESVSLRVLSLSQNLNESQKYTILYCSILKRENFELVCQKATEIGVKEIQPLICERTVKLNLNYERLRKIIKEAAEQAGRGIIPILHPVLNFQEAAVGVKNNDRNFFFHHPGAEFKYQVPRLRPRFAGRARLVSGQASSKLQIQSVGVWIGPEGGWSEAELKIAQFASFQIVSLGRLILRAETAAIIASYLIVFPSQ